MDPLHSKSLGRFCYKLMKQRTHAKNLAGFLCGSVFPELQNFFKGGEHHKSIYAFLKEAPSSEKVAAMHIIHLVHLLKTASHSHFQKGKAQSSKVFA